MRCPEYRTKLDLEVRLHTLESKEDPFIAIIPRSTLTQLIVPVRVPSIRKT